MYDNHAHQHCIDKALAHAQAICTDKGLRLTQLRKRVLELVWQSHGPVKAYDILEKLGDKNNFAKPPTVYRSLDFLTANGLVHRLNSLNAYVGCSHPQQMHRCYFLICQGCSQVKECCNSQLDEVINATTLKNNFESTSVTLEIQGLCEHCQG